jgi:hypothetical protein
MMRIIYQTLTEQDVVTMLGTGFYAMIGLVADKTTTCGEEQVSVVIRQMRKGIEGVTVNCHKDRSRETRSLIEFNPVGVVVRGMCGPIFDIILACRT